MIILDKSNITCHIYKRGVDFVYSFILAVVL